MENKAKKVPLRKCVVSKQKLTKAELIRVVRTPEGLVEVDKTGKKNGRGAYISRDIKVLKKAQKSNILGRHLEVEIPDDIYQELQELITNE
ncbi:MAG: RNase P modulator RnpM [Culicoidibacterales bacterium]